jgi:NAD-reducing hydrogenase large subunit
VIEALGGKKIHPAWAVPGGVRDGLTVENGTRLQAWIPEARQTTLTALGFIKKFVDGHAEEVAVFGNFPSLFLGLVRADGGWEHHDGRLRFMDSEGNVVADQIDPADYQRYIGEAVEKDSYLKSPYFKPLGYPDGVYRVGPLARLNVCDYLGTPLADIELDEYRQRFGRVVNPTFVFHYARLIEILTAVERIEELLADPDMHSDRLRATAGINRLEGVGCSEAPRGTLFHHYHVDEHGKLLKVNLLIATGQNALAMNRTVKQIAQKYITGPEIPEGVLNRVEAGVRAFDPCLSCSTHAFGQMPLYLQLIAADGRILDEVKR